MFCWRITKYNPQYRDAKGAYLKDEWTCYSEIGKKFGNKEFTFTEYEKIENLYIRTIILFMECLQINSLKVINLEKDGKRPKKISFDTVKVINEELISKEQLILIVPLILRKIIWAKLEVAEMYVHFGYD